MRGSTARWTQQSQFSTHVRWAAMSSGGISEAVHALAADVGGTSMRAAVVSVDAEVVASESVPTEPERGIEDAALRLAEIVRLVREQAGSPPVVGLGVATAGPIDPDTGVYDHPPNMLSWTGKSLKPELARQLELPVHVGHDATLAALAETTCGPHKGARNLLYVTVSTGIGGGIVTNGRIVTGARGGAGEVGHLIIKPGEETCEPGGPDTLEGNASGTGIARMAAEKAAAGRAPGLLERAGGKPSVMTSRIVFEAARAGDPAAVELVDHVIESIGIGMGSLINVFDPEALVLGGAVTVALGPEWARVKDAIIRHSLPGRGEAVTIAVTTLGDEVSLLGAARLAFDRSSSG